MSGSVAFDGGGGRSTRCVVLLLLKTRRCHSRRLVVLFQAYDIQSFRVRFVPPVLDRLRFGRAFQYRISAKTCVVPTLAHRGSVYSQHASPGQTSRRTKRALVLTSMLFCCCLLMLLFWLTVSIAVLSFVSVQYSRTVPRNDPAAAEGAETSKRGLRMTAIRMTRIQEEEETTQGIED